MYNIANSDQTVARVFHIECKFILMEHMYITGNKFNILLKMTRTSTCTLRVHHTFNITPHSLKLYTKYLKLSHLSKQTIKTDWKIAQLQVVLKILFRRLKVLFVYKI